MKKIKVASGIYWVEEPESNLRLLCGCPADAVKHLIKKGLVRIEEKNGVSCETGPNAILLSDLPFQNERFSNLAEFPVLQMFYKQGLIMPNHPNNTGEKPMLIGLEDEVKAQAEYIYLGNYGLISEEEILEAGISKEEATEMMRLKKRFAFDNIKRTEELLESVFLGAEPVEIRPGTFIRRVGLNVFEISRGGESVAVDLNLGRNEEYEPSYHLGFHEARREYFSVIHSGEGDGWDINRPCMASIVTFQGKIYLIDAGPNLLHSLQSLGIGVNEIEGIFHTHSHDDHFNGLTVLMRSDHRIKYYATPLVRKSVVKKLCVLASMEESLFDKYFETRDLEAGKWNDIDGLEAMPMLSPHPVETTTMLFRALWDDGYKTYSHLADITSFKVLGGMVTDDNTKSGVTREYFDRIKKEYLIPADLKKIDVGGGMIHGEPEDFIGDKSRKIILSHTSQPFTDSQKEIGENATFGAADVLIPADQDYSKAIAFRHFQSFFPSAPAHEIRMLTNCPIASFNPGAMIVPKGEANNNIFFILSGLLEFLAPDSGVNNKLTSGAMAGELSGILQSAARGSYRAISYVKTIKIPSLLYIEFLKRNDLFDAVKKDIANRQFLQNTWLFGERISCPIKSRIAQSMIRTELKSGTPLDCGKEGGLFLIEAGEVEVSSNNRVVDILGEGDFYGEESIVFEESCLLTARATRASVAHKVAPDAIRHIPVVQIKLLETFKKRMVATGPHFVYA